MNELKFSVLESMLPRIFKETSLNASFCGKNLESSSVEVEKQKKQSLYVGAICCTMLLRSLSNIEYFSLFVSLKFT